MNTTTFPCLWFDGKGKEASAFYCQTFGGRITADTAAVVNMDLFGQTLMILNGGAQFRKNASI